MSGKDGYGRAKGATNNKAAASFTCAALLRL